MKNVGSVNNIVYLHKDSDIHSNKSSSTECERCNKYFEHKEKANKAREEYKRDSERQNSSQDLIVFADLQKVSYIKFYCFVVLLNLIIILGNYASEARYI